MKKRKTNRETRRLITGAELRVLRSEGDAEPARIIGYAARFNSDSEDMGFIERIAPGAFSDALKTSDVRALWNHDSNIVLGRTASGTLTLSEDGNGLWMEVTPPDTQYIRDLVLAPIERGDVSQQSFGFAVAKDEWIEEEGKTPRRTILRVEQLFDVSPVTFPAYPDTDVAMRSMEAFRSARASTTQQRIAHFERRKKYLSNMKKGR